MAFLVLNLDRNQWQEQSEVSEVFKTGSACSSASPVFRMKLEHNHHLIILSMAEFPRCVQLFLQ